jgi:hypothetical protein
MYTELIDFIGELFTIVLLILLCIRNREIDRQLNSQEKHIQELEERIRRD